LQIRSACQAFSRTRVTTNLYVMYSSCMYTRPAHVTSGSRNVPCSLGNALIMHPWRVLRVRCVNKREVRVMIRLLPESCSLSSHMRAAKHLQRKGLMGRPRSLQLCIQIDGLPFNLVPR
jgi:hypothetical protein